MKIVHKLLAAPLVFAVMAITAPCLGQDILGSMGKSIQEDIDAHADSLEFVGSNIIAKGNVSIRYQNMRIVADEAIVNYANKDLEANGNIRFMQRSIETREVELWQLEELRRLPDQLVTVKGYVTKATGKQMVEVEVIWNQAVFSASHVSGNLNSGVFEFRDFIGGFGTYYIGGTSATRDPEGIITIKEGKFSTCEYILDDQEHYSVTFSEAKVYPPHLGALNHIFGFGREKRGATATDYSRKDLSIVAYDTTFRIGDVPVFWLPIFYKPDEPSDFINIGVGSKSELGFFMTLSKKFTLLSDPAHVSTRLMIDLFEKRGIAYGADTDITTEESHTNVFFYGLLDQDPYKLKSGDETSRRIVRDTNRFKIPKYRYSLSLSNLTHITPRLDFRGRLDKVSDINFYDDFFPSKADDDPFPATYFDLEQQFDRFIASVNVRPKINRFYTEVERLPEIRFDIPRQELFHNLYYQGETSFGYYRMNWRDYDSDRWITENNILRRQIDPDGYSSPRLDSLHMFYYPIKIDWLNIIPRAGMRFTNYFTSSSRDISTRDLEEMNRLDSSTGQRPVGDARHYDADGGNRLRFTGEVGLEVNAKFHRTWQDVKSSFLQIDGLRHVIVPYLNYNWTTPSTVNRKYLYDFEDVDRIAEQHFIRAGLRNALQTRRGAYGQEQIYEWASIEHYFDFHLRGRSEYYNFGDFGTRVRINPIDGLTITSDLLINAGAKNVPVRTLRNGRIESPQGIGGTLVNRWDTRVDYEIMRDFSVFARYNFQNRYRQGATYSMGSMLDSINSTSYFERDYTRRQTMSAGVKFPLPFDDNKTKIAFESLYDVELGMVRSNILRISRNLHCWEVALELAQERSRYRKHHSGRESSYEVQSSHSVMLMFYLTGLPQYSAPIRTRLN